MVVSRDGRRSVLVKQFEDKPYSAQNRDGVHLDAAVQLRPREEPCFAQFFITGTFPALWNAPRQTLRWDSKFDDALHEILMMALGVFLDENEVPPSPTASEYISFPYSRHRQRMTSYCPRTPRVGSIGLGSINLNRLRSTVGKLNGWGSASTTSTTPPIRTSRAHTALFRTRGVL